MNIINKLYEAREDELNDITQKDREELLKLYPDYYVNSDLEELVEGNKELEDAFEKYSIKVSTEQSCFNKKFYLSGLKDGLNIMKFAKGDEFNDY